MALRQLPVRNIKIVEVQSLKLLRRGHQKRIGERNGIDIFESAALQSESPLLFYFFG